MRPAIATLLAVVLVGCGAPPTARPADSPTSASSPRSSPAALASATPGTPGPRRSAALGWDPKDGYLLMFGGMVGGGSAATVYGDTWVWAGAKWLQLHPPTSPPARSGSSVGYDPISQRMILYGGGTDFYAQSADPTRNDTWAWDGET